MPELNVVALLQAKPGSEAALGSALAALVEPTLAEEGCLAYELFSSAADPSVFITVERWRGQDDLDAHMKTPHVASAFAQAGEILAAPPAIHALVPAG